MLTLFNLFNEKMYYVLRFAFNALNTNRVNFRIVKRVGVLSDMNILFSELNFLRGVKLIWLVKLA